MSEEMNRQLLEATARESAKEKNQSKEEYTPRPFYQRAMAWVLVCLVILGVILSYYWIAKG